MKREEFIKEYLSKFDYVENYRKDTSPRLYDFMSYYKDHGDAETSIHALITVDELGIPYLVNENGEIADLFTLQAEGFEFFQELTPNKEMEEIYHDDAFGFDRGYATSPPPTNTEE